MLKEFHDETVQFSCSETRAGQRKAANFHSGFQKGEKKLEPILMIPTKFMHFKHALTRLNKKSAGAAGEFWVEKLDQ